MGYEGRLRYLKTKHPDPVRNTPTKDQIKDELSKYDIRFADERKKKSTSKDNQMAVSQIQHYVRVIEFLRYAKIIGRSYSTLDENVSEWVSKIGHLHHLGLCAEVNIARMNADLWTGLASQQQKDSIYQAGMESYHLARHIVERTKGSRAKAAKTKTIEKLVAKLSIQQLIQYPLDSNIQFQRDVLLEQRRYVCRELTKNREGFAIIEARLLKGVARRAGNRDMGAFAKTVLSPDVDTP